MRIKNNGLLALLICCGQTGQLFAADSVCNVVLTKNAFNTESYSENRKILLNQYDHLCNQEYESVEKAMSSASSSGLSVGYAGFSLGASDARQKDNGMYSFKGSHYCREFKQTFNLDIDAQYRKQSTDMALSVWNSCIQSVHSNQLYITYSQSSDGTNVTGTLFRSVGLIGGYGSIKGFSVAPRGAFLECSVGTTDFKAGEEKIYPLVANPTNFTCTKKAADTVTVSLLTDQGDPAWFKLLTEEDTKLEKKISDLTFELSKLDTQLGESKALNAQLQSSLDSSQYMLNSTLSLKSDELRIRITNGPNSHGFKVFATPSGNLVTVKFTVDGGIGESSCTIDTAINSPTIQCDRPISINARSARNTFHANGTVLYEKNRGAIRFNGSMVISNVGQVDYENGLILTVR